VLVIIPNDALVLHRIVQVDAVDEPIGSVFALSSGIASERSLTTEWKRKEAIRRRSHGPRRQQTQVAEVPPVQRTVLHRFIIHHLAQTRSGGVNDRSAPVTSTV
jgi:hypothetical protein